MKKLLQKLLINTCMMLMVSGIIYLMFPDKKSIIFIIPLAAALILGIVLPLTLCLGYGVVFLTEWIYNKSKGGNQKCLKRNAGIAEPG